MHDELVAPESLFSARLVPHRSLTRGQMHGLVAAFAALCIALSSLFWLIGAWPVAGCLGLDVLLVLVAFRASLRAARAYEDISVTVLELHLAKVGMRGARREWRFNPAWVRLEREDHPEFGLLRLALASRGRRVALAAFLGAEQKADFAAALSAALAQARRGQRFS